MPNIGFVELLIIFLVILLIFGAKRIPELARGVGKGIREFKDAHSGRDEEPAPPSRLEGPARPETPRREEEVYSSHNPPGAPRA